MVETVIVKARIYPGPDEVFAKNCLDSSIGKHFMAGKLIDYEVYYDGSWMDITLEVEDKIFRALVV